MTRALRRPATFRARLSILLLAGPAIWIAFLVGSWAVEAIGDRDAAQLLEAHAALQSATGGLLEQAREIADTALDSSHWRAAERARNGPWAGRLEGVGIVAEGSYVQWDGVPVEPEHWHSDPGSPTWTIRLDGLRTRLVTRAGPDAYGRFALATFVLDSTIGEATFRELVRTRVPHSDTLAVEFVDTLALYDDAITDAGLRAELTAADAPGLLRDPPRETALVSPSGELLAVARIDPPRAERRGATLRRVGESIAAGVIALCLSLLFEWRRHCRTAAGLLAALAALGAARGLLLKFDAPAHLLPRELGSPSVYGSAALGGLLGSPADLLLTCVTLGLGCLALRVFAGSLVERRRGAAVLVSALGAVLATAALAAISVSLAENTRVSLLRLDSLLGPGGAAPLLLGWVALMLGAAELLAAAWVFARGSPGARSRRRPDRRRVAVALLPMVLLAVLIAENVGDRLALERLDSEFAPQVLEQASHRRVALLAAVRQAADSLRGAENVIADLRAHPEFLAFTLWIHGDLFHAGYKSSLDLYSVNGTRLSHFGFDLPELLEAIPPADELSEEPRVREEDYPLGALSQFVIHAEMPVLQDGVPVGAVVGHVQDEPSNLAFLPSSEPYLAALGPGGPYPGRNGAALPDYVLYDRRGTVILATLDQPPTLTRELEIAATRRQPVRLAAGEDRYAGLPLLDGDRLHLLLVRSRTPLERVGTFVRLSLLALALLVVLFLLSNAFRRGGISDLSREVRASFYRKLVATLLIASVLPLVGLSLFVRGYITSRGQTALVSAAVQYVSVAQRVVEDFIATQVELGEPAPELNDQILHWLRRLVEQEIHVYRHGRLEASSKRELFASGLLAPRLPGEVQDRMVRGGLPYLVLDTRLGETSIPVAYAPIRAPGTADSLVVAVPLVLQRQEIDRTVDRIVEVLLLATVALVGLLALAAGLLARTVARPVRELVGATGRIASGDYSARLAARTQDEVADLVQGFNTMAASLAAQRADLEQRRDYMEALLRTATTGVVSTDAAGRIVTVNPAMTGLLGLPPAALAPGRNLNDALYCEDSLRPLGEKLALPAERLAEPSEVDIERDGEARRFRLVRVDLPDPAGQAPGSLILVDDVTDLMRSNQLAAWAEMARAIAHEIKNPLTPIRLSTEHLERLLRDRGALPSTEIESCLETVMKQVRALQDIASEFSAYAKLPALAPEPDDAAEFMREVIAPYRAGRPPRVTIEERYRPAPPVNIDRRVLGRAVINLIENALQAMPDGGTLTVAAGLDPEGGDVVLTVGDTGTGLGSEVRARLFEPYFSTKSSGTGLGLAIVKRAVQAHQGAIEVESRLGHGTAIHIRLPAAREAVPRDAGTPAG